jgi:uncharacterized protein
VSTRGILPSESYSFQMFNSVEERSLAERLQPRMAIEERLARTGKKLRKSFLSRHEGILVRPWLKLGLQIAGLYPRGLRNAISPVIRELRFCFADLPPAFDGFQILQLADLHIDRIDGLTEALLPVIDGLRPDVCVLTGDYRFEDEGPCDEVYARMRPIVSSISAKHGIFGILGNHDVSQIAFALEEMGVRMLVNEAVEIKQRHASIWLAGIDDPHGYECDDLPSTLSSVPSAAFKVLLAHTPELYFDAAARNVQLYLCGHTHGGQIRFPGIGSIRNNARCPRAYGYGPWSHREMQGYTSAGVGCSSLPIRFNCPPEVAIIELRRKRSSQVSDS